MSTRPPAWLTTIGAVVAVGVFGWTILTTPMRPSPRSVSSRDALPMSAELFERRIRQDFRFGRYDEALETSAALLRILPRYHSAWRYKALALERTEGRETEAYDAWTRLWELAGHNRAIESVGEYEDRLYHRAWALRGRGQAGAEAQFNELADWLEQRIEAGEVQDLYRQYYNLACYRSMAGEYERATEAIRVAIDYGWNDFAWLTADPDLDGLRDDPAFKAMMNNVVYGSEDGQAEGDTASEETSSGA